MHACLDWCQPVTFLPLSNPPPHCGFLLEKTSFGFDGPGPARVNQEAALSVEHEVSITHGMRASGTSLDYVVIKTHSAEFMSEAQGNRVLVAPELDCCKSLS